MSDMKRLAQLMGELEEQLVVCMRCGMCQAVCPLFAVTGKESDVARGKLALLDGLLNKMFEDPNGVYERLNKCLLCGSCATNCPSGVKVLDIFIKARIILTGFMGLSAAKKMIFRGMLSHPEIFDRLMEWGSRFQGLFTRPASDILGTSCSRIISPILKDRHFVPLAPVPFHRFVPSMNTPAGSSGIKAAFFTGCLIDKIFPKVAQAVLDVFSFHGIGVFIPEGQGCCGIPAISSGDAESFEKLLSYNIEKYSSADFDYLVTACATCTSTIKKIWPLMVNAGSSDDLKSKVEKISEKTLDINQFLVSKIGVKPQDEDRTSKNIDDAVKITYHDPCHLKKSLGVYEEPRILIRSNNAYIFREMPEADWCCGMGGSFNLQYYEISSNIGKRKLENIKTAGAGVVATGCPACMIQISDMLSKANERIAVKHPVEIYAESLKKL
ncbi:MAG: (Fe-S)-binding protein [Desulfobacterales bacterium]|nr:(Fe-S)-binding protein [Desulfobacterales bacterium]